MNFDPDQYREQSLDTWREMAAGWEARNEWMAAATGSVSDWLLEQADPRPGQSVLEVAAGPGDLGMRAAELVGGEGRVASTDFAPEMVEAARRLGDARGLSNLDYRVLDAERMDLADDSFDVVLCRWGYMLMADAAAALAESRRVLREGGSLALAVWAAPERNLWAALPGATLVQRGHMPPPEPGAPGIFGMADPDRIRALLAGAGFGEPRIEEIAFAFRYADFGDVWDSLVRLAGPLARAIGALSEQEREAVSEAISQGLERFRQADGSYEVPALCWGALAR